MTEQASALITFYKGWQNYQQGLVLPFCLIGPAQRSLIDR